MKLTLPQLSKLISDICTDNVPVEDKKLILDLYSNASEIEDTRLRIKFIYKIMFRFRHQHMIDLLAILTPFLFDTMDIHMKSGAIRFREIDFFMVDGLDITTETLGMENFMKTQLKKMKPINVYREMSGQAQNGDDDDFDDQEDDIDAD